MYHLSEVNKYHALIVTCILLCIHLFIMYIDISLLIVFFFFASLTVYQTMHKRLQDKTRDKHQFHAVIDFHTMFHPLFSAFLWHAYFIQIAY